MAHRPWFIKIVILLANLGVGLFLFVLTEGGKYQDSHQKALPTLLAFVSAIVISLLLGFKYISPKWGGGLKLPALFVMAMVGVLILTQSLTLIVAFEDGLGKALSGIAGEIKSNGLFAVLFGLPARQIAFFFFGILLGIKIWLPLWLMNFFLFKMLK